MAFVPAPNIIETEFRYLMSGQQCENRIMVDNLGAVDAADLQAVATAAWDWWENQYAQHVSTICHLVEVVTTDLTTQSGAQYIYAPDATTDGTASGAAHPNEVSLCISLRSASRGRSARGRWFMAGLPASVMVDNNHVTSAYAGVVAGDLGVLLSDITALSKAWVIVSYISNNAPRPGGPVYFPVTSTVCVDTTVDSMKRRKPGVGT